jgi:hypothetical protein
LLDDINNNSTTYTTAQPWHAKAAAATKPTKPTTKPTTTHTTKPINPAKKPTSPSKKKVSFNASALFGSRKKPTNTPAFASSRMTMKINDQTGEVVAPGSETATAPSSTSPPGRMSAPPVIKVSKSMSMMSMVVAGGPPPVLKRKKSAPPPVNKKAMIAARAKALEKRKTLEAMNRKKSFEAINPLKPKNIANRTTKGKGTIGDFHYAWQSQRGYYPNDPRKKNQDACLVMPHAETNGTAGYYGVYDGHGKYGDKCSEYVRDNIPKLMQRTIGTSITHSSASFDKAYR